NIAPVPFDYPHFLTGAFHRWIGNNELHDGLSLYSLGWLQGGRKRGSSLSFSEGARWFISAPDTLAGDELLSRVVAGAQQKPTVCCGMEVLQISVERTPEFGTRQIFRADSPIFLRGDSDDGKDLHILFGHPKADEYLTRTLRHKLDKAGLSPLSQGATATFDRTYQTPKTRLIHIKDDFYKRASVCPVIVEGEPEAVRFAWNIGAGHLTGSGFGSLV
ncbi:MAG TPA: CRISPR-associated endoribonuclease Cas6, partial [Abditibacterium sp.]